MKSVKYIFVFLLVCGLTHGEEVKTEQNREEETLVAEARSDFGNENSILLTEEASDGESKSPGELQVRAAAIVPQHPTYQPHIVTNTPYHHPMGGISPVYQHPNPAYQKELGLAVTSYQQQHPGVAGLLGAPHLKQKLNEKKANPAPVKDLKPDYYPKESSYATIPEQPQETINTPRFVADPNRNQIIEEISPNELQALTMRQQAVLPQQYSLVHQPVQMPGYNFNYLHGAPGLHGGPVAAPYMNPYPVQPETATVKYTQTEHGFIDRMWGEVMTMRQTITNDFFGAIPNFFRNIWDAIVGAVSSTSARMLGSIDWSEAFQFVARQLS